MDEEKEISKAGSWERSGEPDGARPRFKRRGLIADFWEYLMENKKWWIIPILAGVILLTFLAAVSAPALLPFIYTLF